MKFTMDDWYEIPEDIKEFLIAKHQKRKAIIKEAQSIKEEYKKLHTRLTNNQINCEHEYKESVHRADTGNYSKSDDSYWIKYECPDCNHRWTEQQ